MTLTSVNATRLKAIGYVENQWIPCVFCYCPFCKAYNWHTFFQRNNAGIKEEIAVCGACNNGVTPHSIEKLS